MRLVLLVLLSSACVTTASARTEAPCPEVPFPASVTADYYDISGATSSELRSQMNAKGPRGDDGRRNDAYTHWYVNWRYPFHETAAGCTTGLVTTTLKTSYDFPRWTDEATGEPELRRRWHCYQGALLTHEDGHRLHGLDAAAEIEAKLAALPAKPTCPEMDAAANAEGQRILQRYRDLDAEYDAKTKHGATQGATFR